MRTRFLNIDYFTQPSSDLEFPRLPNPSINPSSSSNPPINIEEFLQFDSIIPIGSSQIDTLPIEDALSSFLLDVLPQPIQINQEDFPFLYSLDRDNGDGVSQIAGEVNEIRFDEEITVEEKNCEGFEVIQFETPELNFLSDVQNENLGSRIPYPCGASESIYSVQEIALDYIMEPKTSYSVEDDSSVQEINSFSSIIYPLLEVNETGLEGCRGPSITDELNVLLQKIEGLQCTEKDTVIDDGKELLGSSDIDILECLSDHSSIKQCFDPEPTCISLMIEVDFVCVKDTEALKGDLATESWDFSFPVTSLIQFQEYQILDIDLVPTFETFVGSQAAQELKPCDPMFGEDNKSIRIFYESFVSHELALVDDDFNYLPVPVVNDPIEIRSVPAVLKDILDQIKPHPPSASDVIYLDWHLLQESRCDNERCSSYWNMLEEIDSYIPSPELASLNNEMMIIDFVLGNERSDGLNKLESKEVLEKSLSGVSPRRLSKSKGAEFIEVNEKMAPVSSKRVPQSSKFDFFLNKRKATISRNSEHSVKETTDAEIKLPILSSKNAAGPCASAEMRPQKSDIKVPRVQLSDNFPCLEPCDLPTFTPVEEREEHKESLEPVGIREARCVPISVSTFPSSMDSKSLQPRTHSSPDIIIIMNTQTSDKEMLISRRSSYQKILALEKGGAQVVEREIAFPVDLIISSSMCLVWYNHMNIWKTLSSTEDVSSIALCVENIATTIFMSLSFAFSSCVMVFEGETKFLASVTDSSDVLYAAAASLGIDLQLFCSRSSELTDEIVLNCIDYATKSNRHLYPKMSESETLAESFLTNFPSLNPLSAHAILSSGGRLADFLELSHDSRVRAIGKYKIPDEGIALFSSLCKYEELEDSKSGTTDCSSVSSAPKSRNSISKIQSQSKRQKCVTSPISIDFSVDDDLFLLEPLNQPIDVNLKASSLSHNSQPYQARTFPERCEFDFDDNHIPDKKGYLDTSLNMLIENSIKGSKNVYNGEVIDLLDDGISGYSSMANLGKGKKGNIPYANSSSGRISSSFGMDKYTDFPSIEEINSGTWNYSKDQKRKSDDIFDQRYAEYSKDQKRTSDDTFDQRYAESDKEDMIPLKMRGELLMEKTTQRSKPTVPIQNVVSPYGKVPILKAFQSSGLQQGSPWTAEFLNKVKEKSRMHQESLIDRNIATLNGNPKGNSATRRSPSIIDYYRYQGGGSSQKPTKRKWNQKFIPPPSASKNDISSAPLSQSWTPIDKRARQTLSFAKNGKEKQSKLVWSNDNFLSMRKRPRS
ncbi:hypothetical protein ACHQM5_011412 [Ranunculus cassubicifolius]